MSLRAAGEIEEEMAMAISEDAEIQSQKEPDDPMPEYYEGHRIYMAAVAFTLAWTLGRRAKAPFTRTRYPTVTEEAMLDEWRTAKAYVDTGKALPPGVHPDHVLGVVRALTWALFPEDASDMPPALYA